jgi:uncharacterized membrane protein
MPRAVRVLGWAAGACAVAAYALLAHWVTARATPVGSLGIALAAAPYLGFALALAWRSSQRIAMLALCGLAAALLWRYAPELARHFGWLYFLQHVGANALLGIVFGRTLEHGREPLCSRFAAMAHGPLDDRMARYTRQVTLAWTLFFAANAALSVLLFFAAPIETWSVFANVLSLPLVGLMFVAEYAVRLRLLPDVEHVTILGTMRMYWRNSSKVSVPPSR